MGLGSTAKKIQKVADIAEDLYKKVNELKTQLEDLRSTVDETLLASMEWSRNWPNSARSSRHSPKNGVSIRTRSRPSATDTVATRRSGSE